jgi:hypothetical protein
MRIILNNPIIKVWYSFQFLKEWRWEMKVTSALYICMIFSKHIQVKKEWAQMALA